MCIFILDIGCLDFLCKLKMLAEFEVKWPPLVCRFVTSNNNSVQDFIDKILTYIISINPLLHAGAI